MSEERSLGNDSSLAPVAPEAAATPDPTAPATPAAPRQRASSVLVEFTIVCILVLSLGVLLRVFVTQVYAISGHSMEPTLHDGEMVMINKLSPLLEEIERGDLVIFSSPEDPRKDLIKRVIGLPGDHIQIDDGVLCVNGKPVQEDYVLQDAYYKDIDRIVDEDELFVLGDNRPSSQDSRNFGPIPMRSVKGEVFLRLWPLRSMSTFP